MRQTWFWRFLVASLPLGFATCTPSSSVSLPGPSEISDCSPDMPRMQGLSPRPERRQIERPRRPAAQTTPKAADGLQKRCAPSTQE
ncbi:hypothetical protein LX32DRAFT_636354 [Colletotrichum zoysiae]|uniref:Uncharacterized protein n=1 Tax=Colletotrichum zoysiae TaxID=1216348 RepID=A0AAD9HNU1_9PEZI|nr:hypothetical protein LX32DRAFT_636354 [Colletotrichum zoysiae]